MSEVDVANFEKGIEYQSKAMELVGSQIFLHNDIKWPINRIEVDKQLLALHFSKDVLLTIRADRRAQRLDTKSGAVLSEKPHVLAGTEKFNRSRNSENFGAEDFDVFAFGKKFNDTFRGTDFDNGSYIPHSGVNNLLSVGFGFHTDHEIVAQQPRLRIWECRTPTIVQFAKPRTIDESRNMLFHANNSYDRSAYAKNLLCSEPLVCGLGDVMVFPPSIIMNKDNEIMCVSSPHLFTNINPNSEGRSFSFTNVAVDLSYIS